jgi:hypothetical protein
LSREFAEKDLVDPAFFDLSDGILAPKTLKFPVNPLFNTELERGEWFAADCTIRQRVPPLRRSPGHSAKWPAFAAPFEPLMEWTPAFVGLWRCGYQSRWISGH